MQSQVSFPLHSQQVHLIAIRKCRIPQSSSKHSRRPDTFSRQGSILGRQTFEVSSDLKTRHHFPANGSGLSIWLFDNRMNQELSSRRFDQVVSMLTNGVTDSRELATVKFLFQPECFISTQD